MSGDDRHEVDVLGIGRLLIDLAHAGQTEESVRARGQELIDIDEAAEQAASDCRP